jgi:hypothetical protein
MGAMSKIVSFLTFAACLIAGTSMLAFSGSAQDFTVKSVNWKAPIGPEDTVTITNLLGDVRLRTSPFEQIELTATIQSLLPEQPDIQLRSVQRPDGFLIAVDHPGSQNFAGRVDLGVVVPSGVMTRIETLDGLIEARGLNGRVVAYSKNGDVFLETSGTLEAVTDTGTIFARSKLSPKSAPSKLKTQTGDITLRFSLPADVRIEAMTGGSISLGSAMSIDPSSTPQSSGSRTMNLGDASSLLRAESMTGNLRVVIDEPTPSSGPVKPKMVEQDLRALPEAPRWQPGDPIVEVPKGHRR